MLWGLRKGLGGRLWLDKIKERGPTPLNQGGGGDINVEGYVSTCITITGGGCISHVLDVCIGTGFQAVQVIGLLAVCVCVSK